MKVLLILVLSLSSASAVACKLTSLDAQRNVTATMIESLAMLSSKRVESIESINFMSQLKALVKYTYTDGIKDNLHIESKIFIVGVRPNCGFFIKDIQ